jgi:hypothetical protein
MAGKMFDLSNCATCYQSGFDKDALRKCAKWTSEDVVNELGKATAKRWFPGILVYDVFKRGRKNCKRGRLYNLECGGDQVLVDLFDISFSHRIVGIGWTEYSWAIRVYFEESKDGQTNIDGEVMEAFKRMVENHE